MPNTPAVHKEHKDRLFSFIFGSHENRKWTLSIYNAVNGSDHKNADEIQINTIREVLYLGMHNDVSFQILDALNLYEQQSTFNPNMPLRQMQYAGNVYERYVTEHKLNKFGKTLLRLPVPKLITFYNGTDEEPDEMILKLSDSFPAGSDSDIEVTVRMLNINYGRNKILLDACRPLKEYSWFVAEIRKNHKTTDIEHAVDRAINDMPGDFQIRPFLEAHRAEVQGMLLTEYNEIETMELFKEEGKAEGKAEERVNTERERRRADDAEARADKAEAQVSVSEKKLRDTECELAKYKKFALEHGYEVIGDGSD